MYVINGASPWMSTVRHRGHSHSGATRPACLTVHHYAVSRGQVPNSEVQDNYSSAYPQGELYTKSRPRKSMKKWWPRYRPWQWPLCRIYWLKLRISEPPSLWSRSKQVKEFVNQSVIDLRWLRTVCTLLTLLCFVWEPEIKVGTFRTFNLFVASKFYSTLLYSLFYFSVLSVDI